MAAFKKGDRVRCIKGYSGAVAIAPRLGDVASVAEVTGSGNSLTLQGYGELWYGSERFELVDPEPPVHELDGRRYVEKRRFVVPCDFGWPGDIDDDAGDLVIVASPLPASLGDLKRMARGGVEARGFTWDTSSEVAFDATISAARSAGVEVPE